MWEDTTPLEAIVAPPAKPGHIESHPYLHTLHRREFAEPELRLMLVILQDALRCLEKYSLARPRKGRRLFEETERWVLAATDDEVFSFNNICEALGLNPAYVRKRVMQWKTMSFGIEHPRPSKQTYR
jgi:hypothetical protein